MGYQMVKFRSAYANGTQQTETLSLTWEDGAWKVAGIVFSCEDGSAGPAGLRPPRCPR